ncbi:Dam family site-specific DNA-(adenine-N6)-methyltransferase [Streptococcus parasuis]|uniref:Dam family site-specific DNA-(adenine-N6)-methyltransferase n=1 Tax=Streptococcus TaxID=1301 RepID=UPI001374B814|nr:MULTISPECIES: Dam family site-specific DNA-(adenine-N6)-methyltransferase [Streptococcus]KAF1154681.1 DNA adenine methylase [Streptococcus agalactiae]KAF1157699.1 DNA adenine methylase [Streptococcus agalactiae]WJQ85068.1 Dam family site-specific DNA-(adenine-N6)-methyltransferase [Streptococcus parasuis]
MRYIGSKKALLIEIKKMVDKHAIGSEEILLDLFAGTNSVGNYFKQFYTIYSNDLLFFSYVNAKATIENNSKPLFSKLVSTGIQSPMNYLENLESKIDVQGYYETAYSPSGNANYLTVKNAKKLDTIRTQIDDWKHQSLISEYEYYYLLSSLIESLPFISNTTGTYGAFLKHWDKRALNDLELQDFTIFDNKKKNKAFNEDANTLVKRIKADIVYIDTPYNSRQYASNYHLLENVARNNQPILKGVTKIFDWKNLKSDYATKSKALDAMEDLIKNIDATHIILSYNNEGIIPEEALTDLLMRNSINGKVDIKKIPYRKYQSKRASKTKEVYELLFYIQKKPFTKSKKSKSNNKITVSSTKKYIKSPLNYIGGKYKLLKQILPLFPSDIDTFVDIFSGGANVGINVNANKYIFNDMNNRINEMFRYFQEQDPVELVQTIEQRIEEWGLSKTNEEAFLAFRKQYNLNPNPLDLYILSSFSYNYQFRFNNSMEFNNPFGRNRSHFSDNMKSNLLNFVTKLQTMDATFTDFFFSEFDFSQLTSKDFVYLDPPYLITTGSYNDGKRGFSDWGEKQEKEMYQLMKNLSSRNIKFALSNVIIHKGKHNKFLEDFIEEENLFVKHLNFNYKNSSYNTSKEESLEVLVTNYKTEG